MSQIPETGPIVKFRCQPLYFILDKPERGLNVLFCFYNLPSSSTRRVAIRGAVNGNCIAEVRKTSFGQSSFSVIGTQMWNNLPTIIKTQTEFKRFNRQLKHWLKENQKCNHDNAQQITHIHAHTAYIGHTHHIVSSLCTRF